MNSKTKSTLLLVLLTVVLIICGTLVLTISINKREEDIAYADGAVSYISRSWDSTKKEVVDTTSYCSSYTVVGSGTTTWNAGWYVVNGNVTINSSVTTSSGIVHLILCDGANLTINGPDCALGGQAELIIYGQSSGTGELQVHCPTQGGSAIGCSGGLTINGGKLTADEGYGVLIGSGNMTINGGELTANGNDCGVLINSGNMTINGGKLTAHGGAHGVWIYSNSENMTINDGIVNAKGNYDSAIKGTVINRIGGTGWTDSAGTEGQTSIPKNTTGQSLAYGKVQFVHYHSFTYTANGATITRTCTASGCPLESNKTLTINAPTSLVYNGNAKNATFTAGYDTQAFPNANSAIKYYKDNVEVAAANVKTAGVYTAKVTFGNATAQVSFEITKANPTYTIPTGLQATYGDLLSSVALPSGWSWKNPSNTVGNAGNVENEAIYTPQDTINYNVVEVPLTIAVAKADPAYTIPTNIEVLCGTVLSNVALPEGFTWMDTTQKVNVKGEQTFKAKYTPEDTANYNIVENIDIIVKGKWIIVDPTQNTVDVEIDDGDSDYNVNITVKVEVKTDISVEAKRTDYANLAKEGFVAKDEDISMIYGVKLIRTTNGVEEEIQPSDIKEGQVIKVSMAIPEDLIGKEFRLLHIHSAEDITEVAKDSCSISTDGKTLYVETDRLSEFAFVSKTDAADNGFVYSHGFCVGWVVFIFVILELLATCLYIIIRYGFLKELVAKCKLTILSDKIDLMTFIGLCVSGTIFLFAFIVLCCHQCAITIISFIFALFILCPFVFFFLLDKGILTIAMVNGCINKIKEKLKKVEENKEEAQEAQDFDINDKDVVEPQQKEE